MTMRTNLIGMVYCGAIAAFAESFSIASLSDYQSSATALHVRAGDTITLPTLGEGEDYAVLHEGVGALDGNVVTILKPGILGIEKLSGDRTVSDGVMAVLSLPEPIGNGRVFVWKPTHWASGDWSNPEAWDQIGVATNSDYPRRANDIAICARYGDWGYEINLPAQVTLGGLMMGSYMLHRDLNDYSYTLRGQEGVGSTLTFQRTDKKPAWIQYFCNGTAVEGQYYKICSKFGDSNRSLRTVCGSDVEMDLGWVTGKNSQQNVTRLDWATSSVLEIPEDRTLVFRNGSPYQKENTGMYWIAEGKGSIVGGGRIVNAAGISFLFDFEGSDFTGTIVESAKGRDGYDRNANTWFSKSDTLEDAGLEVHGYVKRVNYKDFDLSKSAGYARIGLNHTYPGQMDIGNRLAGREVALYGGRLDLRPEETVWNDPTGKLRYETGNLAVKNGFTYLIANGPGKTSSYPEVRFSAQTMTHAGKGTVILESNRLWVESQMTDRVEVNFPWFQEVATGGIVPWLIAYSDHPGWGNDGGWQSMRFPTVDEDGNLRTQWLNSTSLQEADAGANVYCYSKDLLISEDKTINSLVLLNTHGGGKMIGAGKTLTIASGGLVLQSKTRIGDNSWGQAQPSANCGTLAFGDTAYVFANSPDAGSSCWIMSQMVAPYGFVSGYPGFLMISGDQTGIDDEIVVQAGQLTLGIVLNNNGANLSLPCEIDVPVRIVGGGSTLVIADVEGTTLDPAQNVYFDDVGGFSGKLSIPEGKTETCSMLYTRNSLEGEAWVSLPRGTYGASGSGAETIDDARFAGGGILVVRRDDLVQPTMILMR